MASVDRVEKQGTLTAARWPIFCLLTLLLVLVSALAVVSSTHQTRQLFAELQLLQRHENDLATKWRQMLVEKSALASHGRVERIARQDLGMKPATGAIKVMVHQ